MCSFANSRSRTLYCFLRLGNSFVHRLEIITVDSLQTNEVVHEIPCEWDFLDVDWDNTLLPLERDIDFLQDVLGSHRIAAQKQDQHRAFLDALCDLARPARRTFDPLLIDPDGQATRT